MSDDRLAALNQKILDKGLFAYWMRPERRSPPEPRVTRWREVYPLLLEAGEIGRASCRERV